MSGNEADEAYSLKESVSMVGPLTPVLLDKYGNTIDGNHRLKENKKWPVIKNEKIDSPLKLAIARIVVNCNRRIVTSQERRSMLKEVFDSYLRQHKEYPKVKDVARWLGRSQRWVYMNLDPEYKDPEMSKLGQAGGEAKAADSDSTATQNEKEVATASPASPKIADEFKGEWWLQPFATPRELVEKMVEVRDKGLIDNNQGRPDGRPFFMYTHLYKNTLALKIPNYLAVAFAIDRGASKEEVLKIYDQSSQSKHLEDIRKIVTFPPSEGDKAAEDNAGEEDFLENTTLEEFITGLPQEKMVKLDLGLRRYRPVQPGQLCPRCGSKAPSSKGK